MQLLYINPDHIERDPEGVREEPGDLTGLAETIRDQGLLQPLGVVPIGHDRYRVVYGGRRLAAAQQLGLERVPCILLDTDDPDLLLRQMIENVQRRDLNDMEKAFAFQRLREQLVERSGKISEADIEQRIGQAVGLAPRTVRRYFGLLDLPPEVQQLIRDEELTVTQAQHIRRIERPAIQIELAQYAADEGLSAAEVAQLAAYFAANPNLNFSTALEAIQSGATLRTEASDAPIAAPVSSLRAQIPPTVDPNDDRDLWGDEPEDEEDQADAMPSDYGHLTDDDPSRTKARVFRIKSLDQMVDETDRLSRALYDGDVRKWVKNDDTAPFKVRLLLKQLRSLARALEGLAHEQGWAIEE